MPTLACIYLLKWGLFEVCSTFQMPNFFQLFDFISLTSYSYNLPPKEEKEGVVIILDISGSSNSTFSRNLNPFIPFFFWPKKNLQWIGMQKEIIIQVKKIFPILSFPRWRLLQFFFLLFADNKRKMKKINLTGQTIAKADGSFYNQERRLFFFSRKF